MVLPRGAQLSPLAACCVVAMLGACGDGGAEVCAPRSESYHVTAALRMREPAKSVTDSGEAEAVLPRGKLLVTVEQDRSIQGCHDGLVTESYPAQQLLSTTIALDGSSFTLDVPSTFYPAIYVPMLWLQVRLDENGNGHCDDGELAGVAELARDANVNLQLELVSAACPLPAI